MNARMPMPEGVIRNQVSPVLVLISLAIGFALDLMPWTGTAFLLRPDFLLVVLLYWCMEEPRRVGATSAFLLGLLMDVAESSLIGQNALVYSLAVFLALEFRLRILRFNWPLQALHVLPILFVSQCLFALQQLFLGTPFPDTIWFVRSALGMALWPLVSWLLELPRRQPVRDEIA